MQGGGGYKGVLTPHHLNPLKLDLLCSWAAGESSVAFPTLLCKWVSLLAVKGSLLAGLPGQSMPTPWSSSGFQQSGETRLSGEGVHRKVLRSLNSHAL